MRKSTKTTVLIVACAAILVVVLGFFTSGFQKWSKDDVLSSDCSGFLRSDPSDPHQLQHIKHNISIVDAFIIFYSSVPMFVKIVLRQYKIGYSEGNGKSRDVEHCR